MLAALQIDFPNSIEFALPKETEASVAIIMRTKDRPVLLVRALASVIAQRFTDWHLFLINDGGDIEILQKTIAPYLPKFAGKFTLFNNPVSLGMEAASNVAARAILKANNGENVEGVAAGRRFAYAVVHDDDDSWNPDFLFETTACLDNPANRRAGGVCTKSVVIEERIVGETVQILTEYPFRPDVHSVLLQDLLEENKFPPIAFLFRTELFSKAGLYNENLPVLGDWDFNVRAAAVADIAYIDKPLAYYHHRRDTGTNYGNSVIATEKLHRTTNGLYKAAILRAALAKSPENAGMLLLLASLHRKMDELDRRVGKNYLYSDFKEFLHERFFKHFFKLLDIPPQPAGKKKRFLKRLDSFFYQVFIKPVFGKETE